MSRPPSRSLQLSRELLRRIIHRDLRPGDPIDVQALGRHHGVSRTVVREALAELVGKGLVQARAKVGTTVAPESGWQRLDADWMALALAAPDATRTLSEAAALRRLIEPALAAGCARNASRESQQAVLRVVRRAAEALGAQEAETFSRASLTLHRVLSEACDNRLLRSIDHALAPARSMQYAQLLQSEDAAAPAQRTLARMLGLQTRLGMAVARRDPEQAARSAQALVALTPVEPVVEPAPAAAPEDAEVWPETVTLIPAPTVIAARARAML